jgi:DNA-binding transcriptional ArsR family regulator
MLVMMFNDTPLPPTHRTLTTEAEIAAYLHRTRMAILHALRTGPATGSQIAAALGVHPANLTRHIRTLRKAGLISLVETRDTGRTLEKYYAAVATSFDIAPEANLLTAPHKIALAFARSDLSMALAHLPDEDRRPVVAMVAGARVPADAISRFQETVAALVEAFAGADAPDGEPYHLTLCLYPGEVVPGAAERITLTKEGGET